MKTSALAIFFGTALLLSACEKEYFPEPPAAPKPHQPVQTTMLEAAYSTGAPTSVTSSAWKTIDFVKVPLDNLSTKSLYGDGFLNMTSTYNGLSDFNGGKTQFVTMKAAYDNDKLYIYMEWEDTRIDPSCSALNYDGNADPRKSGESAAGWTSQGNTDQASLVFDIDGATGTTGTFKDLGYAACWHNGGNDIQSGKIDIWNWNLALSEPLGYALDKVMDKNGDKDDQGTPSYQRNSSAAGSRVSPLYETDGTDQTVTRGGKSTTLDKAYYLLKGHTTAFTGDAANGYAVYLGADCNNCHGDNGEGTGPGGDGYPLNQPGNPTRYSRDALIDILKGGEHPGASYFATIQNDSKRVADLLAWIRGHCSVPGYVLDNPTGSCADIATSTNVTLLKVDPSVARTKYQVVMVRKLSTGNADDAQFSAQPGTPYTFGVTLSDGDGKNFIGSNKQTLIFKSTNQ